MSVTSPINFITPQHSSSADKPYQLKYVAPIDFPSTNIVSKEHSQKLEDVRGCEAEFSIAKNGFTLMRLEDGMAYDDYDHEEIIREVFYKRVADRLKELLGASRVQIFEHVVSV